MTDLIQERSKMTAKDFFIHVASIVSLYATAIALLTLLFQVIDISFPDQIYQTYDYYSSGMRFAVATIFVLFPLYLVFSYFINRGYVVNPEKRELGVRKWLTFLTLFIAGAVIAGDLITLLYKFLGGEISSRFVWKVLAVLVVTGIVFGYYLYDLRRKESGGYRKTFILIAAVIVIGSLVWGFSVMGSPMTQRKLRFDNTRVQNLLTIQSQITYYWQQKGKLPATLGDIADPISGFVVPSDPDTKVPYEYTVVKGVNPTFSLCATFSRESEKGNNGLSYPMPISDNENWLHKAGRQCFERTIDPQLYPINKNGIPIPQRIY